MRVRREVERPEGASVSYTQLSQNCGLKLKFKRAKVPVKDVGISLLYGRALHAGIEARAKGRARDDEEAVRLAVASLRSSIQNSRLPVSWDDWWTANQDGGISADTYGKLCNAEACEWWLGRQVRLYLERYPEQRVRRSEHHIFVPLTQPDHVTWRKRWSLECYLDREMDDGSIHDIKSATKPWDVRDVRKGSIQALVYMGAYYSFYGRQPSHFEFHILPRLRAGEQGSYDFKPELQVVRVEWDPARIQAYLDSVVKPQITIIEQEAYVANPADGLCSEKWCSYWTHCSFGSGKNL